MQCKFSGVCVNNCTNNLYHQSSPKKSFIYEKVTRSIWKRYEVSCENLFTRKFLCEWFSVEDFDLPSGVNQYCLREASARHKYAGILKYLTTGK